MSGIVVSATVRSSWKQIVYWSLGLGLLGFYITFIGSDSDIVQGYANLFESMPPALLEAFGASSLEILKTQEGWIVSILVSEAGLFLSAFAVIAGLNISANDEQSGLMDVILSLPVSRGAYLLERWLGYALIGLAIHVALGLIVVFSALAVGSDADPGIVLSSILNLYPGTLLVMTVTNLLGSVLRRRAAAIGLSIVFVVASYVFGIISGMASGFVADLMRSLSYFTYAQGEEIVLGGYDPAGTVALLLVALAAFAGSVKMFERRDIGL